MTIPAPHSLLRQTSLGLLLALSGLALGQDHAEGLNYFEAHVRPVLAEHCYKCHSQKSQKLKAGLYLDSKAGILKGSESGVIIVPGKPDESLLLKAVRYQVEDLEMPPKKKLQPFVIDHLAEWIRMGAPMPDDGAQLAEQGPSYDWDKFRREHWAFRPVQKPHPPISEGDWAQRPIDHFVLNRLKTMGLSPAPAADKRTLIRRAYFTLIGLPPTHQEVATFVQDEHPEAFAKVLDHLLASPHYGERWGRHWLDVARYSDGMGASQDNAPLPNAWRYRDWVVRAFNRDLPYDQFVKDQIAGDLNPSSENRLGTGFFAVGPTYTSDGGDPESKAQAEAETLSDRVDTFSRAFLALTAACARCHDHKFDPITAADYYSIAGIFRNSRPTNIELASPSQQEVFNSVQAAIKAQDKVIREFLDQSAKDLQIDRKEIEKKIEGAPRERLAALRTNLDQLKKALPPKPPTAHGLGDSGSADMHIAIRGDLRKKGALAPRKFLQILAGADRPHFKEGSGRRQLADAVADPKNPLTARVMVNRIWLQHFGKALVRSPSNFGVIGQKPTHPGLLDWLAATFVEDGWSMKKLHRAIMLSATWQMSSDYNADAFTKDGDNNFLWRMNPRRLDVEAWRDSLLAVSGELDPTVGGSPDEHVLQSKRRTIYGKLSRNFDRSDSEEFLRNFDFPSPRSTSPARTESTVPQQYLFILNSPFMLARAEGLAKRLQAEAPEDEARIVFAYALLFQRPPLAGELSAGFAFVGQEGDQNKHWRQYAQVLLATHEFMQAD